MVRVHNLEIRLDIEGNDDEAAFVRLFDKYIRKWQRAHADERARQQFLTRERRLDDHDEHNEREP